MPNPSFEERIDFNIPGAASNWSKCLKNDTPDYIEFTKRGEPEFYYRKYIGGLLPYDGEAYAGIFCYRINELRGIDNIREFIQVPLKEKLEKDTLYRVSMAIALDPESTTAINSMNILFSREPLKLKREKEMFEFTPQIRFQSNILDSTNWILLEAEYKARGYETHLVIGNFMADNRTRKKQVNFQSNMMEKWNLHELERASYYYIDMVSVLKQSEWLLTQKNKDSYDAGDIVAELTETDLTIELNSEIPDTSFINLAIVKEDSSIVLNNIFFEFDRSELLTDSYAELDRLYGQLLKKESLQIIIEGHTDNMGTYEYNQNLSIERARAVVEYLLAKGISEERISYQGYGYTRPLSDNRSEEGRRQNRRVAFRIKEAY